MAEGVVAAEHMPLRPLDAHEERLPRLAVGEHLVCLGAECEHTARVNLGEVFPHHRLDERRHIYRPECLPFAAPLLLPKQNQLGIEVDVLTPCPETFAPPRSRLCGRDEERVEVAGVGLPTNVGEYLVDLCGVEEQAVPKLAFPSAVHSTAGEDGLNLVVGAEWLRLFLLRK